MNYAKISPENLRTLQQPEKIVMLKDDPSAYAVVLGINDEWTMGVGIAVHDQADMEKAVVAMMAANSRAIIFTDFNGALLSGIYREINVKDLN